MTPAAPASAPALAATLRALHHRPRPELPLVLPGPWDAASARAFADAGFPALATPSAGIAASLGHEDGATPADEMFAAVARIVRAVPGIPVSADIESGYGLPAKELAARLAEAGAVGCNLEDTDHTSGTLLDAHQAADRLAALRAEAGDTLVINARIDTFVHATESPTSRPSPEETIRRGLLYTEAGADALYPILAPPTLLPELAAALPLPLNALATPTGPSPTELGTLGASRITFGPGLQRRALAAVTQIAEQLLADQTGATPED